MCVFALRSFPRIMRVEEILPLCHSPPPTISLPLPFFLHRRCKCMCVRFADELQCSTHLHPHLLAHMSTAHSRPCLSGSWKTPSNEHQLSAMKNCARAGRGRRMGRCPCLSSRILLPSNRAHHDSWACLVASATE